jgi:iron complex outermembrane receptor protein
MSVAGVYPKLNASSRTLHAQRATTLEIGSRGSIGKFGWSVTAYRGRWRNEILRLADADGQPRGAVNAGPTVHVGVETALRWTMMGPPQRLSLHATSTLGRFHFDGDPVYGRNRIAGAPPHVGAAELLYDHASGFFAALEPVWSAGRTSVDHAGRLTYGGHTLLHARAGWRPREGIAIVITCHNLFDRAHLASTAGVLDLARSPATTAIFLPGAGRGFSIGIEWKAAKAEHVRSRSDTH